MNINKLIEIKKSSKLKHDWRYTTRKNPMDMREYREPNMDNKPIAVGQSIKVGNEMETDKKINPHGHIYLYSKGHYQTTVPTLEALKRIFGHSYIIDPEYITDSDLAGYMLRRAMVHNESNNKFIMDLVENVDPEHWRYKLYEYTSHSDAVIRICMSTLSLTSSTDIDGELPEADFSLFFTEDERVIKED